MGSHRDLTGKQVLITGASSGIGEATARLLAKQGALVTLTARRAAELERVVHDIRASGGRAQAFPADLSDPRQVERLAADVQHELGLPDILINNAGAGRWLSAIETDPEEARRMIEVPYLAAFYVSRAFLPALLERGSGHLITVTSPASYLAWPGATAYIAARHALKGLTEALRAELRPAGLDVSLVVLGAVESPYWQHNPGSRERVPQGGGLMTTDAAARAVLLAITSKKHRIVRPQRFKLLFALEGLCPGLLGRLAWPTTGKVH